jgi:sigma-B regulation protein RsbU (phosphoserine phosphatase)
MIAEAPDETGMDETGAEPLRNAEELTRAIFGHATRIDREQNPDEIIRLNADFARDLVGADRCSLWLIDGATDELWTKVAHGTDQIRIPMGKGIVGACVEDDRVLVINDIDVDRRLHRQVDQKTGYRTKRLLCVPLRVEGRVIGALQLLNKPTPFTETDAGLLGLLGHFAANAIEGERLRREAIGAKLVQHELGLAHDVQMRLLPENPEGVAGLECVGFCRPARSIGGDYYDLLPLRDGSFAVTLGDVSGKGIPAAVMMASIQTLLRSLLQRDSSRLAEMMHGLNETLYSTSTPERYSTLFCGVISADRRTLTYVNAGQVQPLLLHADGRLERFTHSGLPVGLLPEASYEQQSVQLLPGDLLVIVSDGMVEACNEAGDFWDEEEVDRVVMAHTGGRLHLLTEELCHAVDCFADGAQQYDDMTVVAVRVV